MLNRLVACALALATLLLAPAQPTAASPAACATWQITGYVPYTPTVPSLYTYDGTYVFSGEALAASTSLPIGSYVSIPHLADYGLPTDYRIADRGHLAGNQIDVLIWTGDVAPSIQLARAVSGPYDACVY